MGKRDTELRKERDRELFGLYLRGLREQNFANMHEAADWVRSQPASKYYVSAKSLVNYIGAIQAGKPMAKMYRENERKIRALYELYKEFMGVGTGMSRERICEILVEEPAPCFFICHDSAMKAIQRERVAHKMKLEEKVRR